MAEVCAHCGQVISLAFFDSPQTSSSGQTWTTTGMSNLHAFENCPARKRAIGATRLLPHQPASLMGSDWLDEEIAADDLKTMLKAIAERTSND